MKKEFFNNTLTTTNVTTSPFLKQRVLVEPNHLVVIPYLTNTALLTCMSFIKYKAFNSSYIVSLGSQPQSLNKSRPTVCSRDFIFGGLSSSVSRCETRPLGELRRSSTTLTVNLEVSLHLGKLSPALAHVPTVVLPTTTTQALTRFQSETSAADGDCKNSTSSVFRHIK